MTKKILVGAAISVAAALAWSGAMAADPTPQYSAKDIANTFADQPAPTTAPAGECEKKGMVTGDDGICEPVKNERGFSLPTRASQASPKSAAKAYDGPAPARVATATASAPVVRRHASRDLLITFKLGSSELTGQGRANAKVFAEALQLPELSGVKFNLGGYTDASGDKDKNLTLSQQRADAVKTYLVSLGVDGGRLDAHGFGSDDLADPSHPNSAENRRVVARKVE